LRHHLPVWGDIIQARIGKKAECFHLKLAKIIFSEVKPGFYYFIYLLFRIYSLSREDSL
jgi:hypothetical protein